jgi:hypothetical protein
MLHSAPTLAAIGPVKALPGSDEIAAQMGGHKRAAG